MKIVLVVYNSVIEPDLMNLLEKLGITSYTKWTGVQGKGRMSEPHLGTEIWPATNSVLALALQDRQKESIIEEIRSLRSKLGKEGLKAFVLPLEEIV